MERVFYSNGFNIIMNPTEARIRFTLQTPLLDDNANIVDSETEVVGDVILHPSMARQLAHALEQTIKAQEEKNGTTMVPPIPEEASNE